MPVRLSGSTSGYTELSAPAVAGNNTITFPTTSGTAVVNGANSAIVSGTAVASTSGTSIDFTGIPSWAKRVTVVFSGVSTSGTSGLRLQLGSGSVTTSGYFTTSSVVGNASTTGVSTTGNGFDTYAITAATLLFGSATINLLSGNLWIGVLTLGSTVESRVFTSTSQISLSSTLDRVRITTVNGTDTFDAGSINILYE